MNHLHRTIIIAVLGLLTFGAVDSAKAYYDRYPDGYWDHHGRYQHYVIYHRHRGYWDERNGVRVFITL